MTDDIAMPVRQLGPQGPTTSVFGLGSWNTWDRMTFDDAVSLVRMAVDAGVTLFDVAHYNMGPHAEGATTDVIFGEAVRAAGLDRSAYKLCGKLWMWEYPQTGFDEQMTESLDRIGVQKVDAVVIGDYMQPPDIRRVVSDVAEQVRLGRVDSWGVNNWPAADVDSALGFAEAEGLPPPSFAQLKYSIARRSMAEGEFYQRHFSAGRLALQASDVFEGGVLLGNLNPERKIGADPGSIRDRIRAVAATVAEVAADFEATPAQVGIAFCLQNPAVSNVLFGVSSRKQLEDNLAALQLWRTHGAAIRAAVEGLWLDQSVTADGTPGRSAG